MCICSLSVDTGGPEVTHQALIIIAEIRLQQEKENENRIRKSLSIRWVIPLIDKYNVLRPMLATLLKSDKQM